MTSERTPHEQRILDRVAERKGEEWVEEHSEMVLTQARLKGDL